MGNRPECDAGAECQALISNRGASADRRANTRREIRIRGLVLGLLAGVLVLVALQALKRPFDSDEIEAIHTAWKVYRGETLYVDFFQHHHPFLYYLLAWLFPLTGEGAESLIAMRVPMLVFCAGMFALTYGIARVVFGGRTALVCPLMLALITLFADQAAEVRPDVPQVLFGLAGVYALYRYLDGRGRAWLLGSGLALGIAFMFLQKAILLFVILCVILGLRVWSRQLRLADLALFGLSFAVPFLAYLAYAAWAGTLERYWFFNFTYNAYPWDRVPAATLPTSESVPRSRLGRYRELLGVLKQAYAHNAVLLAFFLFGLAGLGRDRSRWEIALIPIGLSLIVLGGVHYPQYWLPIWPFVAILAAHGVVSLWERSPVATGLVVLLALVWPCLRYGNYIVRITNDSQIALIEYVLGITRPSDYVYDGNREFNVFRRDLDFFWFGVGPRNALGKYQALRSYPYDIYALIDRKRPKVLSQYALEEMGDPRIAGHYVRSERYRNLYIRTD